MTALVDVLIPAFNAAATLRSAIASIQNQTVTSLRIIVVDDGSTDETPAILAELARSDCRITVITQANQGIVDALNAALLISDAPYIARHDADDIAYSERLQQQVGFLNEFPDYVAVGANAWHIDANGMPTGARTFFIGDVNPDPYAIPAREPHIMHPFLLVRRDAMTAIGGYRHCFYAEDADLYWRLWRIGKLFNLSAILGEYRVHADGISGASANNGRIGAVYSQLAALSYVRQANGKPDIPFARCDIETLGSFDSFQQVLHYRVDELENCERERHRKASAAKLIDIASYRSFFLSEQDCYQVSKYLNDVPPNDRRVLRRNQAEVLRRYIDKQLWSQIRAMRFPLSVFLLLPLRYVWKVRKRVNAWRIRTCYSTFNINI